MVVAYIAGPELQLPWAGSEQDDQKFRRFLRNGLIAFALVSLIVPFLPVKEISREQKEAPPPQLARVILEKKQLPKPEPVVQKPKPKPIKKPPVKPKVKPKQQPKPVDLIEKAKATAAVSGVLAFQDDLAEMRESLNVDSFDNQQLSRGAASAAKTERAVITSKSTKGSGGIQVAAVSRDTGGQALSGRETTKVKVPDGMNASKPGKGSAQALASTGRSDESVRRVMDKNKGAIFSIYHRALRKAPDLEGQFVFEMTIEPSGQVSKVTLISSELADDQLAKKILARVRMINFGAAQASSTVVNYSFDFLPY